jgi:hypothetical protein
MPNPPRGTATKDAATATAERRFRICMTDAT